MIEQGSVEWFEARQGMLTASMIHRITNGTPKGKATIRKKIVAELMGAPIEPSGDFPATCWGKEYEQQALDLFTFRTGLRVFDPGFVTHSTVPYVGASPDGLIIGKPSGIEVKCPYNADNHLEVYKNMGMPKKYFPQVQCQMWVCGAPYWYFVSFDPRQLKTDRADMALYVEKIERDDVFIKQMERQCFDFWKSVMHEYTAQTQEIPKQVAQGCSEV